MTGPCFDGVSIGEDDGTLTLLSAAYGSSIGTSFGVADASVLLPFKSAAAIDTGIGTSTVIHSNTTGVRQSVRMLVHRGGTSLEVVGNNMYEVVTRYQAHTESSPPSVGWRETGVQLGVDLGTSATNRPKVGIEYLAVPSRTIDCGTYTVEAGASLNFSVSVRVRSMALNPDSYVNPTPYEGLASTGAARVELFITPAP